MARKIKALGVKMVLSGEGSDEIFGGYLYFHKAPNKEEFHLETCRKVCFKSHAFDMVAIVIIYLMTVWSTLPNILLFLQIKALHMYDCLRANKATSAWGLEARVPFLDKAFIDLAMSIDPAEKMVSVFLCNFIYSLRKNLEVFCLIWITINIYLFWRCRFAKVRDGWRSISFVKLLTMKKILTYPRCSAVP